MRVKIWSVAIVGLSMTWGASLASAQFSPRARPMYGQAQLRAGFMPDPHVMSGSMGGPVRANQMNSRCRGYISGPPNHVINTRTGFRNLRIIVNAPVDSTLVVMLPNGALECDDDGGSGMNPLVQTATGPGRIAIWVGAYSQGSNGRPYSIGFSELGHVGTRNIPPPGQGHVAPPVVVQPQVTGIAPQMPAAFGSLSLRAGFMPDPHVVSGTAGGPIRGNTVNSSCRGHYSPQPSHVLMTPTGFRQLRIIVNASRSDTTLLVMLPNGQIVCNDDGGSGSNPLVVTSSQPGAIRVWVGTYSSGRSAPPPYNIGFSELGHIGTNNIPLPGRGRPGPVVVQPVQPVQPLAQIINLTVGIPTTLLGPAMTEEIVAGWAPSGGPPQQIRLQGINVMIGNARVESIPRTLRDPTVTVTQRRNGNLVLRAEQPPMGRGDRGQTFLLHVAWQGRPVVVDRWSGNATQRGPRWSR